MSTNESNFLLIAKASDYAKQALAGLTHRDGRPAYEHSEAVAASMAEDNPLDIVVAYLHDVCEDTPRTLADINAEFGGDVTKPVFLLTRTKGFPWDIYIRRICMEVIDPFDAYHHFRAARVKIADMKHNLSRIELGHKKIPVYQEAIAKLEKFLALPE